jgi:hypothetical protein
VLRLPVDTLPATPEAVSATYDEHTLHLTWRPAADGQQFRVVRVDRSTTPATVTAVTPEPTPTAAVEMPVEFGREFCLAVLPLRVAGAVIEQGDPSAATCLTPADTFPPPAPTGLQAVQDGGSVTLIWTPVDATDLAGYVVLRGDGAGAELTPLFREPLAAATYRDGAVTPGRTYTYAVYAVDGAASPNVSQLSERQTVTVR